MAQNYRVFLVCKFVSHDVYCGKTLFRIPFGGKCGGGHEGATFSIPCNRCCAFISIIYYTGYVLHFIACKLGYLFFYNYILSCGQIVQVWLKMKMVHVSKKISHAICGHFVTEQPNDVLECSFCNTSCGAEVIHTFYLKITLADESGEVSAWCTGHTATELLQISPDEFFELPEVMFEIN